MSQTLLPLTIFAMKPVAECVDELAFNCLKQPILLICGDSWEQHDAQAAPAFSRATSRKMFSRNGLWPDLDVNEAPVGHSRRAMVSF